MNNAIECRGVGKDYPRFTLDGVDLVVPEGSVMGFVGPNGAGKSTTLRIVTGAIRADRGTVEVLGRSMPREQIAAKWDLGYFSEDMRLYPSRTVDFHARWMESIYPSWDTAYERQLYERFEVDPGQKVKHLSHGQRVKAGLMMVLARRPRVLVLDEPTSGLDPLARRQILDELSAVRADEERAILFSSHNTLDVEQLSDEITFLARGRVVFTRDKESLLEDWRRIRLEVPDGLSVPEPEGVVDVQRSGRLAVVTTRAWSEATESAFRAAGATVSAVERMSLEEIFLAAVSHRETVS